MDKPCWLFYSNLSQIEWLKQQDLSLPEGYSYVELKKSDAAHFVLTNYIPAMEMKNL